MHNYVPKNMKTMKKIVIYNPHPYPVTITIDGYSLGGRESAEVLQADRVVANAIKNGFVIKLEDEAVAEIPVQESPKKKKSSKLEESA